MTTKRIVADIPPDMHKNLKQICVVMDISMKEAVSITLNEFYNMQETPASLGIDTQLYNNIMALYKNK